MKCPYENRRHAAADAVMAVYQRLLMTVETVKRGRSRREVSQ